MKTVRPIKRTRHLEMVKKGKDTLILLTEKQDVLGKVAYVNRNKEYIFNVIAGQYEITDDINREIDELLSYVNKNNI